MSTQDDIRNQQMAGLANVQNQGANQLLGSGQVGATPAPPSIRMEAGDGLTQAERYTCQVERLENILAQTGIFEQCDRVGRDEAACNPNDLKWTVSTATQTVRAANNRFEDLLNCIEQELL